MSKKIIVIAGPTASGKTSLSIEIAKKFNGEIVSADSMQVYKGMPIATACPTYEQRQQVPHHLVEIIDSSESFSVSLWCDMAREAICEILNKGKVPIIVGGTGLFIDSLVDNIKFNDVQVDEQLRAALMQRGTDDLYRELMSVDAHAGASIHKNNKKRVVRALELYYSGVSKTQQNIDSKKEKSPYDTLYFVLEYKDRQVLYDRINKRVDLMLEQGLLDETKKIMSMDLKTAKQAIGHKELIAYLNKETDLPQAVENLKKETRHYAKRQMTWFRRRENSVVIYPDELGNDLVSTVEKYCEDFLNG